MEVGGRSEVLEEGGWLKLFAKQQKQQPSITSAWFDSEMPLPA